MAANSHVSPPSLRKKVLQAIKDQSGLLFALPALVGRNIYAGRGVIAPNTDFSPSNVDHRGYVPVEWWIMSKSVAKNAKPLENEGMTSILIAGKSHPLPSLLEVANAELMGKYDYAWPLAKVVDIGGPAQVPNYSCQEGEVEPEVPPVLCHVHAGEVCNGVCIGPGKLKLLSIFLLTCLLTTSNWVLSRLALASNPEQPKNKYWKLCVPLVAMTTCTPSSMCMTSIHGTHGSSKKK